MLPDKMEHCIVFMNSWDVSGVFWSFSKCNITIPHFPTVPSTYTLAWPSCDGHPRILPCQHQVRYHYLEPTILILNHSGSSQHSEPK